jgi:hypothetical protein
MRLAADRPHPIPVYAEMGGPDLLDRRRGCRA